MGVCRKGVCVCVCVLGAGMGGGGGPEGSGDVERRTGGTGGRGGRCARQAVQGGIGGRGRMLMVDVEREDGARGRRPSCERVARAAAARPRCLGFDRGSRPPTSPPSRRASQSVGHRQGRARTHLQQGAPNGMGGPAQAWAAAVVLGVLAVVAAGLCVVLKRLLLSGLPPLQKVAAVAHALRGGRSEEARSWIGATRRHAPTSSAPTALPLDAGHRCLLPPIR
jgi:hypothetical protein